MTKISNEDVYIVDNQISDLDSLIGTDGNTLTKQTKNFLLGKMKKYFVSGLSPLNGGTLRFTEISYNGQLYTTPQDLINSLDPSFTVEQYHVVVVAVNGAKSILKLQNVVVGDNLYPVLSTDFIVLPTSVGPQGPQGVQGPAGTNGTNGTNGSVGSTGPQGPQGTQGVAGTNGTNGTNGIDATSNNLQRTVTSNFTVADTDNNFSIIIDNGSTPITITIPPGLLSKIGIGFAQNGTGDVTFVTAGTTFFNPIGSKIKGQGYSVYLEQVSNTNYFLLLGDTKA